MSTQDNLREALLGMIRLYCARCDDEPRALQDAREALAAQEAEPVAWIGPNDRFMLDAIYQAWKRQYPDQGHKHFRPLYAAPPARLGESK